MDVDEPGQQSKQRELQRIYLEKAPDYFPAALLRFWSASWCLLGAFGSCRRLLPSVFVSASLLHVPLLVPAVLLQENRDPARDLLRMELDREQGVPERMLFRPGSKPVSVIQSIPRCT